MNKLEFIDFCDAERLIALFNNEIHDVIIPSTNWNSKNGYSEICIQDVNEYSEVDYYSKR